MCSLQESSKPSEKLYTTKELLKSAKNRSSLPKRDEPYWYQIMRGTSLGYNSQGGTWTVRKYVKKKYHRELLGFSDDHFGGLSFAEAQRKAVEYSPLPETDSVSKAWENYISWIRTHGKDHKTPTNYYKNHINPLLGEKKLSEITTRVLEEWQESVVSNLSNPDMDTRRDTCNRITHVLKAILNKAFRDGLINSDLQWRRLQSFKGVGNVRIITLSQSEINRVLEVSPQSFQELFLAALYTGCRYSELRQLEHGDFDGKRIHVRKSKSKKSRMIPLNEEGREFFSRTPLPLTTETGCRWSTNTTQTYTDIVEKKTGIIVRMHYLRHTYATRMLNAGANPSVIAKILGHSSTKMVEKHYGHLYDHTIVENVERFLGRIKED